MDETTITTQDGVVTSTTWWDRPHARGRRVVFQKDREGAEPITLVVSTWGSAAEAGVAARELLAHFGPKRRATGEQGRKP
jgi:hypothetical protein